MMSLQLFRQRFYDPATLPIVGIISCAVVGGLSFAVHKLKGREVVTSQKLRREGNEISVFERIQQLQVNPNLNYNEK